MLYISMKVAVIMVLWTEDGSYEWSRLSIPQFREHFPSETLIVVDNNKNPDELAFVRQHTPIVLSGDRRFSHGAGIDIGVEWCRKNGVDVAVHIEPDCIIKGRKWFNNLLHPIGEDTWMTGGRMMVQGYIHICPSAWLLSKVRHTFKQTPRRDDIYRPEYEKLINIKDMVQEIAAHVSNSEQIWYHLYWWDTGVKNWFDMAVLGKTKLVDTDDLSHYWFGRARAPQKLPVLRRYCYFRSRLFL